MLGKGENSICKPLTLPPEGPEQLRWHRGAGGRATEELLILVILWKLVLSQNSVKLHMGA